MLSAQRRVILVAHALEPCVPKQEEDLRRGGRLEKLAHTTGGCEVVLESPNEFQIAASPAFELIEPSRSSKKRCRRFELSPGRQAPSGHEIPLRLGLTVKSN